MLCCGQNVFNRGKVFVMERIPTIVLTGGPCAGKTSAQSEIRDWLLAREYKPIFVPEAATTLIAAGFDPTRPEFQVGVLRHVLHHEAVCQQLAQPLLAEGHRPVIVADRGVCDQLAYMGRREFEQLLALHSLNFVHARDERYDGVICLQSAANGAEQFYSKDSNSTRYESLEEARLLDGRTRDAWIGVPHLSVIENVPSESFMGKIGRSVAALARILGEPEPLEAERKFLIEGFSRASLPAHTVACDIVQTYLVSAPHQVERVRARGHDNYWVYTHTIKQFIAHGVAREQEKIITRAEYESYLVRRDFAKEVIQKTRFCFVYAGHYCELDVFRTGRRKGDVLLEIEVAQSQMEVDLPLPPFLHVLCEVTHDRDFSNVVMATPVAA